MTARAFSAPLSRSAAAAELARRRRGDRQFRRRSSRPSGGARPRARRGRAARRAGAGADLRAASTHRVPARRSAVPDHAAGDEGAAGRRSASMRSSSRPSTATLPSQSADQFVTGILDRNLGVSHAVTGFDFHFGKDRQGGPAFLMAVGRTPRLRRLRWSTRSATRAPRSSRRAVSARCLARATWPKRPDCSATATRSRRRCPRQAARPDARLPDRQHGAAGSRRAGHGIYAVRLPPRRWLAHDGVASFGRRPTVDSDGAPLLETFVFDFDGDLYGETCAVSFFGFLRGEEKFDGLDALVAQMRRDEAEARALLAGVRPLSAPMPA